MALPELKEYCLPESGNDVTSLAEKYGEGALFVAGGTYIHGLEARGFLSGVEALIDLSRLGLGDVSSDKKGIRAGATAKFASLLERDEIELPAYGALRDALSYPPAQIKNLATVGGSIAAACPFFDVPAAFIALDGVVTIEGPGGSRELPVVDVAASLFENTLEAGEYIAGLLIPEQDKRAASAYLKLETNANDLAMVGVGVRIRVGRMGKISDARVVLGGGLSDRHFRSAAAEAVLDGAKPGDDVFDKAAEAIASEIDPISDHRCSGEYRARIGQVYVKRALQKAVERLG